MFIRARRLSFEFILTALTTLLSKEVKISFLLSLPHTENRASSWTLKHRNHWSSTKTDEDQDTIKATQARCSCSRNSYNLLPVTLYPSIPRLSVFGLWFHFIFFVLLIEPFRNFLVFFRFDILLGSSPYTCS